MSQPKNTSATPDKTYSAFWPLLILLLGFISIQCVYLKNGQSRTEKLRASLTEINTTLAQAQTIEKTLESVGRDLNDLAVKNAEAAKIVQEFQIKVHSPTGAK